MPYVRTIFSPEERQRIVKSCNGVLFSQIQYEALVETAIANFEAIARCPDVNRMREMAVASHNQFLLAMGVRTVEKLVIEG